MTPERLAEIKRILNWQCSAEDRETGYNRLLSDADNIIAELLAEVERLQEREEERIRQYYGL